MYNKGLRKDNKFGASGIKKRKNGKYQARCFRDGRDRGLGCYHTVAAAKAAIDDYARIHLPDKCNYQPT